MKEFDGYKIPRGEREVREYYGEPGLKRCRSGLVVFPEPTPGGQKDVKVHELAVVPVKLFFERIHELGLWKFILTVRGYHLATTNDDIPRHTLSTFGASLTINRAHNPDGVKPLHLLADEIAEKDRPGFAFYREAPGESNAHPVVVIARELGFEWGGDRARQPEASMFNLAVQY